MVRGNHTHERSDITNFTHNHGDTGWVDLALINGWVNFDAFRIAQCRKIAGIVYCRGVIKDGADGTDAFIMPVGFRMAPTTLFEGAFPVQISTGIGVVLHDASTGAMRPTGGGTTGYTYLVGISYPADS